MVHRFAPFVLRPEERREADTTDTAIWMMKSCAEAGTSCLNYDAVGIGAGVNSTLAKADDSSDKEIAAIAATRSRT